MKKLTGLLLIFALVFTAVGCGNNANNNDQAQGTDDGKATVTMGFWGTAEDLKVYQDAANSIKEEYPNITLKIKQYPSSEQFWNTLPGEIAAGVAPDLIKVSNEGAYEYIDKGLFAPLDDIIASANIDMDAYTGTDIWNFDGKQYGIPNINMPAIFFINKDMWEAANLGEYPKTWDEVEAAAKKLTKDGVYGIGINIHPYHLTNYIKSYGGGWGNGATINSTENVKALDKVFKMYEEGIAVTPKTLGYGWDGEVFANGKAAMTTGGYWYKGFLKEAAPDLNYVALPIPKGTVLGSTAISDAYVVLKDTENKKAALQATSFLTNEKIQRKFMDLGFNPALKSLSAEYFEANPEFKALEPAIEYSTDFGYPTESKKFSDMLVEKMEGSILGGNKQSAKEILDSIQKDFQ